MTAASEIMFRSITALDPEGMQRSLDQGFEINTLLSGDHKALDMVLSLYSKDQARLSEPIIALLAAMALLLLKQDALIPEDPGSQGLLIKLAVESVSLPLAEMLPEKGITPDRLLPGNMGVLYYILACLERKKAELSEEKTAAYHALFSFFAENRWDVDYVVNNKSLLFLAAEMGEIPIISTLLKHGASLSGNPVHLPLTAAVGAGSLEAVRLLLEKGAKVNDSDGYGITPVMKAAQKGSIEILTLLLREPVLLNNQDKSGRTALHWATLANHPDCVRLLLSAEADPYITDFEKASPFYYAVVQGAETVTALFLEKAAATGDPGKKGRGLLFAALMNRHFHIAEKLVKAGFDFPEECKKNCIAACLSGSEAFVHRYLKSAGDMASVKYKKRPLLFHLIENSSLVIAGILIRHNRKILNNKFAGMPPLIYAIKRGSLEMVRLFKENLPVNRYFLLKLSPSERIPKIMTPLLYALGCGKPEVADCLLDESSVLDVKSRLNKKLLQYAIKGGCHSVLTAFLKHNNSYAFRFCTDIGVCSPLLYALRQGLLRGSLFAAIALMKNRSAFLPSESGLLLKEITGLEYWVASGKGAYSFSGIEEFRKAVREVLDQKLIPFPGRKNAPFWVDLFFLAVDTGNLPMVQFLSGYLNPDIKNRRGETPLHRAVIFNHYSLAAFLCEKNADTNSTDYKGRSPLFYCTEKEIACCLLEHGADENMADKEGRTFFHCSRSMAVMEAVVEYRKAQELSVAAINAFDKGDNSPLQLNILYGNRELACLLIHLGADFLMVNKENQSCLDIAPTDRMKQELFSAIQKRYLDCVKVSPPNPL